MYIYIYISTLHRKMLRPVLMPLGQNDHSACNRHLAGKRTGRAKSFRCTYVLNLLGHFHLIGEPGTYIYIYI